MSHLHIGSHTLGPLRRMPLLRLYTRVLDMLGKEARLAWILAAANLLLAMSQFAEPVLFGRIVDTLSGKSAPGNSAWPLLGAWAGGWPGLGPCHYLAQRLGGAESRPPLASPAPGGADRLFRAYPPAAD